MKMLDVVLPDSHETVDLCDGNADQGSFLVFSKNGDFIGVILYDLDSDSYKLETATNGASLCSDSNTNDLIVFYNKLQYRFPGSVPQAIRCFLESTSYESCIRNAIYLGGDADTIGAISGSIAYAYWKEMNEDMKDYALEILPKEMIKVINDFDNFIKQQ